MSERERIDVHKCVTVTHPHVRKCRRTPPWTLVKRLANGSLTTHQISAQSVQPFPRYGNWAYLHVRTCRCSPMTCVIFITVWSPIKYQIRSQSAEPSQSSAANFDSLHAARAIVVTQIDGCGFHSRQKGCSHQSKTVC